MSRVREERGAALLIAVAIFTVLVVIALTFYSASRLELQTATNVENSLRADLINNAGLAMAIAHLKEDKTLHPTATSLDHGWNTFFNGAWLAGKPWAFPMPWANGFAWDQDRLALPTIYWEDVKMMEFQLRQAIDAAIQAGDTALAARLSAIKQPLYVPRKQANPDLVSLIRPPTDPDPSWFMVRYDFNRFLYDPLRDNPANIAPGDIVLDPSNPNNPLTPAQRINMWADVDNNDDGLKDSIWIPIPIENFYGGVDRDSNGVLTVEEGGDGIDNDLDGVIDEADEVATFVYWGGRDALDNDGDGLIDEGDEQRVFLTAPLAADSYWGGNDGVDNDGDGQADEADEQRAFFTATDGFDNDGDGQADEPGEVLPLLDTFQPLVYMPTLKEFVGRGVSDPDVPAGALTITDPGDPAGPSLDRIDNDYSIIINDGRGYAFSDNAMPPVTFAQNRTRGYNRIETSVYPVAPQVLNLPVPFNYLTAFGEAVCDIGGRVAVLITDESSKVNLNTAGALARRLRLAGNTLVEDLTYAYNEGVAPHEYELRTLPQFGRILAPRLAQFRYGVPDGVGFAIAAPFNNTFGPLQYDVNFPGYGAVDDNGDAFWLSFDGLDNDGDGAVDELFEGIDDPGEFQLYRPLRNRVAETSGSDLDGDGAIDEIGELGDRLFRTGDQFTLVGGIGPARLNRLNPVLTAHAADRNDRNQFYVRDPNPNSKLSVALDSPPVSGLRLDYNFARAEPIALALKQDWDYPIVTDGFDLNLVATRQLGALYGRGLRREDATIVGAPFGRAVNIGGVAYAVFEADAELRAYQLALNVQESRDTDHTRNEATTSIPDDWWRDVVGTGEERQIRYTMSGVESIRINEIMVRPVRRVEAEAVLPGQPGYNVNFDPNLFSDGTPDFDYRWEASPGSSWARADRVAATAHLGDDSVLTTTQNGAIIQFRFGPSAQLPPGRYYLLINTQDETGAFTGDAGGDGTADFDFRVKYDGVNGGIISDGASGFDSTGSTVSEPIIGYLNPADPTQPGPAPANVPSGWVFLPTSANLVTNLPAGREGYAGLDAGNPQNAAFTVMIPPFANSATNQLYLYLAIRNTGNDGDDLAINFIEFSQEPDHEWVEIVNIAESGSPIDLSGWQLEVAGDWYDGTRAKTWMTIPEDTLIAPGGSLLLGFNKYDFGAQNFTSGIASPFAANGIGLVRGPDAGNPGPQNDFSWISEPPIPRYRTRDEGAPNVIWGTPVGSDLTPAAESIFLRAADTDFVDRDGDGLADGLSADDLLSSTNDRNRILPGFSPFATPDPLSPTKAWDRIVELEVNAIRNATSDDIARMVLGGGIFPNYPERDLIDNDRDNGILMNDGVDNDGDGTPDPVNPAVTPYGLPEGVDEGRYRRYAHRELGLSTPGIVPGSFADAPATFGLLGDPAYVTGAYRGAYPEWPEWKEFVERRFFPGDNVVVTLYEGPARDGRVADRITYSQRDVENRAIDDERDCPYPGLISSVFGYWPDNTMAVDFYRSLERKHPLYNGDRFGTQNRWLATDGNYDDWGPGTNRGIYNPSTGESLSMLSDFPVTGGAVPGVRLFAHGFSGSPLRPNFFQRSMERDRPLPDNAHEAFRAVTLDPRVGNNVWTFDRAKVRNRNLRSPGDLLTVPHMTIVKTLFANARDSLGWEALQGQNGLPAFIGDPEEPGSALNLGIKGPLVGMDYPKDLRALIETAAFDSIVLSVGQADFYPLYPLFQHIASQMGGNEELVQWNGADPPRAWSPVFLFPLDPTNREQEGAVVRDVPVSGPPVYPHLPNTYPIEMNFLFDRAVTPPGVAPVQLLVDPASPSGSRWPIAQRAVMYVAANEFAFDPLSAPHIEPGQSVFPPPVTLQDDYPSEALFVWDGADGLPNGEYDVYVSTLDNIDILAAPVWSTDPDVVKPTDFAVELASKRPPHEETAVDLAFFTDTDGNRRCWEDGTGPTPNLPDTVELGRGVTKPESFGLKTGLAPSSDGLVHYGVVKIENNFLAMFIRNWGRPDRLNRVSRVILMSRDKTPGRININTAQTHMVLTGTDRNDPNDYEAFNPLMGVPGLFGVWDPNTGVFNPRPRQDLDDIVPSDAVYQNALDRAHMLVASRGFRKLANSDIEFGAVPAFVREDGRYFLFPSELVARGDNRLGGPSPLELIPNLDPLEARGVLYGLAQADPGRFDEMRERFARIANTITTRSDVFEIVVTAQAGSGFDANRDGRINWRDDREFQVLSERRTRTVYER